MYYLELGGVPPTRTSVRVPRPLSDKRDRNNPVVTGPEEGQ
jgi:hypothetical protein